MTKYLNKTFTVPVGDSKAYRDNYDAIFRTQKPQEATGEKKPRKTQAKRNKRA